MNQRWKTHRVSAGVSLVCFLLAANALVSERVRVLPFTDAVYRRDGEPVVFWVSVAILLGLGLGFPVSLVWSAVTRKRAVPFAEQVNALKACGVDIADSVVARLQQSGSVEAYERDPYRAVLAAIADEDEVPAPPRNFFYLDTEAIGATGDYVSVAEQMVAISRGTLTATGLKDELDAHQKTATLRGTINGIPFRWDMPFDDDYIHERFFDGFTTVMNQTGSEKIFAGLDLGGQDLLVFCVDEDQIARFKEHAGLALRPL
jgi:hypothetical protein